LNRTSALVALAGASALIAGCGSSGTTTSGAGTPASATNAGGGPYGAATSGSTSASGAGGTALAAKTNSKLGTIVAAGPKHLTVYMFLADTAGKPTCSGACASVWPPVPAGSGSAAVSGGLQASKVGTVTRSDGTKQLTYAGHPLYYFASDSSESDAGGEGVNGFGALWYAVAPSGEAVKGAGSSSSSSGETSGGGKGYSY
jgi:predicted lipoprotein with Yx(FWY)xxD motif